MLGAAGFVGRAVADRLAASGGEVVRLERAQVDLAMPLADQALKQHLHPGGSCVFIAARAPCKTPAMLAENIAMANSVCAAISAIPVDHFAYVSSDAVYADQPGRLNEDSLKAPDNLHGVMHLARELMLRQAAGDAAFAILRPTLIYGAADPHSGYGPNQYRRLAAAGRDITLFGDGEERRDHVLIDDVAEIVTRTVTHRSVGTLNIASGAVHSFRDIAEQIARLHGDKLKVLGSHRTGPMPHGGYRAFDIAAIGKAFPDLQMTQLPEGIERVHRELTAG